MSLSNYLKNCAKNLPGNFETVFLTEIANVSAIADYDGDGYTGKVEGVSMVGAAKFKRLQGDIDTVQFTQENYETKIVVKCSIPAKDLFTLQDELAKQVVSGVAIIRLDNNGRAFVSGIDFPVNAAAGAIGEGKLRPYNKVAVAFDSGTKPSDEGTQAVTITISRESSNQERQCNATISAQVANGTYSNIDWT